MINMKKIILLLALLFMPINVFAYSSSVIPGGDTLGIEVDIDGILITGFYKINGKLNKGNPSLMGGDYIVKVNDIKVNDVLEFTNVLENADNLDEIKITYRRNGKENNTNLPLIKDNGKYKTGLYVKSSIKGIGTLSYIDPETKIYGALGHEIDEIETSKKVEIKTGIIFNSKITKIEKSYPGVTGSKLSSFNYNIKYGDINKNTKYGIFGTYIDDTNKDMMEIGIPKIGKAYIKTVINGEEIKNYDIEITRINETSDTKNITLKILDDNLINKTGGIVQGMSGSPIIQNDKIVGVLTHVIVDNPVTGYGIFITKMLEEGEK